MIKRPKQDKTFTRIFLGVFIIIISLYAVFELYGLEKEMINSIPGGEVLMVVIVALLYGCFIVVGIGGGTYLIYEAIGRRLHPEKYNYCKKCKCIIKKAKNRKFCGDCFEDIEMALKSSDLLKYKKDFLKQKEKKKC